MRTFREVSIYIVIALFLVGSIIFVTNQLSMSLLTPEWFSIMSSVSTSISSIVSFLLLFVTFFYLLATRSMVYEMKKQRESQESPVVSVRIVPDATNFGILNICVKNTGGSPAYDVSIKFDPDLPYKESSLNTLAMFNNMPVIDKNENIEFLFASAHIYFNSESPKSTTAEIQYYRKPRVITQDNEPIKRTIKINLEERRGQLYTNRNGLHDLVKEVEEIKQGLMMLLAEKEERK